MRFREINFIYYSAAALNWAVNSYQGCNCLGVEEKRYPDPPGREGLAENLASSIKNYQWLISFSSVGFVSTLVAISLLKTSQKTIDKWLREL